MWNVDITLLTDKFVKMPKKSAIFEMLLDGIVTSPGAGGASSFPI